MNGTWQAPPKKEASRNKYLLQLDGDMWMVADITFENIQESDCAFGKTPNEALSLFQDQQLTKLKALAVGVVSEGPETK